MLVHWHAMNCLVHTESSMNAHSTQYDEKPEVSPDGVFEWLLYSFANFEELLWLLPVTCYEDAWYYCRGTWPYLQTRMRSPELWWSASPCRTCPASSRSRTTERSSGWGRVEQTCRWSSTPSDDSWCRRSRLTDLKRVQKDHKIIETIGTSIF